MPTLPSVADQAGTLGTTLSVTLPAAAGGNAPIAYTATPLPAGLGFVSGSRTINGTPSAVGTVTVTYTATDDDGDSASVSFDFVIAAGVIPRAYRVRVDWDGDGLFANPHADVTSDLVDLPKAIRGRNYGDQIYGRSEAGYLEAILRNSAGLYNRFDNASDLVDLVVPGRLVEFAVRRSGQSIYRTRWSGLLDDVRPIEVQSGRNRVRLTALGPLSLITQTDVSVAAYANIETDTALGHVLDAADVPAERRGPVNGNRVMARWWSRLQTGMAAARELEETELGFLYETKADAQIAMDAENARLTGAGRTSQFAMTRDGDPGSGRNRSDESHRVHRTLSKTL